MYYIYPYTIKFLYIYWINFYSKEVLNMGSVGYAGGCHGGGYGGGYRSGSGFALLVVLFILLIIVGATFFHKGY